MVALLPTCGTLLVLVSVADGERPERGRGTTPWRGPGGRGDPVDGEDGSEERLPGAGREQVEGVGGVLPRPAEAQREAPEGDGRGDRKEDARAPAPPHDRHGHGPEEIELLLDGERPGVEERVGARVVAPVGASVPSNEEVRDVEERPDSVLGDSLRGRRGEDDLSHEHGQEDHDDGVRQESQDAARVELLEREGVLAQVAQEDRRYEISGEDEEDVHSREPSAHGVREEVERDDRQDGDGPDAVECRFVFQATAST